MHELSIALSILEVAAEEARRQGGGMVTAIHVQVGAFSGVVKEALLSAYEVARIDSTLAQAVLLVEEVPAVIDCETCQAPRTIEAHQPMRCPVCGTPAHRLVAGRELDLTALEMAE